MIWTILALLTVLSYLHYMYFNILFRKGLGKTRTDLNFTREKVSVIVAARNEEETIVYLLLSLLNQSYPRDLFEVIIADDGSEDQTAGLVNEFIERFGNLKLIQVTDRDKVISAKKNALSQAIAASSGDIILTTDADCMVGRDWISSHVVQFTADTDMVAGFSRTRLDWEKSNLAGKFDHFDSLLLFMAAAGAINSGKIFSCSGQNLAYRRQAYDKIGGFRSIAHLISGDDVNLMQLMGRNNLKIRFNLQPGNFVLTRAVSKWREIINQRSRWASNMKWQVQLNPEFFFYLSSVLIITILPWIIIFKYWYLALIIMLTRGMGDLYFIKKGFQVFGILKKRLKFYPVWFIFQPFYMLMVTLLGLISVYKWKR
ncbi:MAG: glycosyltransferase [Candidatus Cloacimonetes bacterium]|nr:glycosyltransferase [Candidatus Cloacimonadota bacterium]